MLFQCYVQILLSVDEHIVLVGWNTVRNPEFRILNFELAGMDNSECKANFTLKKNIIWLFCMTLVSRCLQHTFSLSEELTKENSFFRSMELVADCSVNSRRYKNIFNNIFSSHVIYFSSHVFEDSTRTVKLTSDVTSGFKITSGCRSCLKKGSRLKLPNIFSLIFHFSCLILHEITTYIN